MPVNILKRPSIPISSDVWNTYVNRCIKNVTVETSSKKTNSPWTVSSSVFIATLDGTIFKPKQLPKSKNIVVQKLSKGLKQKFEWKVKKI